MSNYLKFFIIFLFVNMIGSGLFFMKNKDIKLQASAVVVVESNIKIVPTPEPEELDPESVIIINPEDYLTAILNDSEDQVNNAKYSPPSYEVVRSVRPDGTARYAGPIAHIFFHSLIVYPEKAARDHGSTEGYNNYMVTQSQFKNILQQIYDNNFILIDSRILYEIRAGGGIARKELYLPPGKKPLVLSLDDLSYYNYMKNGGFANKLVMQNGKVKTEVITPAGETIITNDGDVVPIIDDFVEMHPDFSWKGAKGIIALTGYEGILGYDTHIKEAKGLKEIAKVRPIVQALKNTGWSFANHSYSHGASFRKGTLSEGGLTNDINKWRNEVGSIVGTTEIFIGPFGQIFKPGDPRRQILIDSGFPALHGVGLNHYLGYFSDHIVMDRIDIDGYRIRTNPNKLRQLLGLDVTKI